MYNVLFRRTHKKCTRHSLLYSRMCGVCKQATLCCPPPPATSSQQRSFFNCMWGQKWGGGLGGDELMKGTGRVSCPPAAAPSWLAEKRDTLCAASGLSAPITLYAAAASQTPTPSVPFDTHAAQQSVTARPGLDRTGSARLGTRWTLLTIQKHPDAHRGELV